MNSYTYRAINGQENVVTGTILGDSASQARAQLRDHGLSVLEIRLYQPRRGRLTPIKRRVSVGVLTVVLRELATLLSAGIPLLEALETIATQHRSTVRDTLRAIHDSVAGGSSLASAMSRHAGVFDVLSVSMIEVGENSGSLETVLRELANFKEKWAGLKDQIVSSLIYPTVVLAVGVIITLFLMTIVVPMILTGLIEAGRPLPWPTRVLKSASDLLLQHGLLLALFIGGLVFTASVLIRTQRGQWVLHRTLLRLPLLGSLVQKQAISRVAFVISTLLRSGMTYVPALELAAKSCQNQVIRAALLDSREYVTAGADISRSLDQTQVFPPVVLRLFAVGQQSGNLEELLDQLAADYDRQVNTLTTRLAAVLEPTLIVLLAVFVGFILFATLLPILEAGHVE